MNDLLVLCYHAVSDRWPASLSVTRRQLADQLGLLVRRGYRGATFTEAATETRGGRCVVVTFDDAYRSVQEKAFPILERLGLPGTVFAPTAFVGTGTAMSWPGIDVWHGTEYERELLPLAWEELGELMRGGWEVGSHTRVHARLPELDDATLREELRASKEACERHLGVPCRSIAYPYGAVDERVAAAAADAGYIAGAALPRTLLEPTRLRWPRVGVFHKDHAFRFRLKVSRAVRHARRSQAWSALERQRQRS